MTDRDDEHHPRESTRQRQPARHHTAELFARRRSVQVCALCGRSHTETRLVRGATGAYVCGVCATLAAESLRGAA